MKFTERQLQDYSKPLSASEEERCKNAIRMIRDALITEGYSDNGNLIKAYEANTYSFSLRMSKSYGNDVVLLLQGSYANNTNIRQNSDVDIAVILESTFVSEYRPGVTRENYGFTKSDYKFVTFKDEIQRSMERKFGISTVERKNKSIKVVGNSYRVDGDVVPAFRLRDYREDYSFNDENYLRGIEIRPDKGLYIRNYPEVHIKNGKEKNIETSYYYKRYVRIIKKMREIMKDHSITSASKVSSFGLESLLWNVPNSVINSYSILRFSFDEILKFLQTNVDLFESYKEANGIKPLFENQMEISEYRQFINDINVFYEYDI